jgi:hypothetical protein
VLLIESGYGDAGDREKARAAGFDGLPPLERHCVAQQNQIGRRPITLRRAANTFD